MVYEYANTRKHVLILRFKNRLIHVHVAISSKGYEEVNTRKHVLISSKSYK